MPPYTPHQLIEGFKEKVDTVLLQDETLYVASSGSILTYKIVNGEDGSPKAELKSTKKGLFKRPIETMGYLQDAESLVVLSDSVITILSLPDFKPTPLPSARYAQSFGIHTSIQDISPSAMKSGKGKAKESGNGETVKTLCSVLVVGCRKKVVVVEWRNGRMGPVRELILPHSPRLILFPSLLAPSPLHLAISPTEHLLLNIPPLPAPLTFSEPPPLVLPGAEEKAAGAQMPGMGALTGLGGYVNKGIGALGGGRGVSIVGSGVGEGEVLVMRDNHGVFVNDQSKLSRPTTLEFSPLPPDDLVFSAPHILSSLPSIPSSSSSSPATPASIQIRLAATLSLLQVINLPTSINPNSPAAAVTSSLLPSLKSLTPLTPQHPVPGAVPTPSIPLVSAVYVATPNEKVQLQVEGITIWGMRMQSWGEMLEEMARDGRGRDGLGMLDGVPEGVGVDKAATFNLLTSLDALAAFSTQKWDPSINTFISLNITPARIVALYPAETVSGRLHVPQDGWVEMFGGPKGGRLMPPEEKQEGEEKGTLGRVKGLVKKGSVGTLRSERGSSGGGEGGEEKAEVVEYEVYPPAALEALALFLSDRRQKLAGAIAALTTPLPSIDSLPPLKSLPPSELLDLPSVPMTELTPEQLVRVSQVVYTALLKVYLAIRPVLVGSLCRIENWCEVEEVEELLKERKKFGDLIDLYQGKKMHEKALALLKELAKDESDPLDALPPTIRYLQKLGPPHLPLILSTSTWVFARSPSMALQIFTADEPEVEALPRGEVLTWLEGVDRGGARRYLEWRVERGEMGEEVQGRLGGMYLEEVRGVKGDVEESEEYKRLLEFLRGSDQYRPDRMLGRLSGDEFPRVRAILLGKLGNHEAALQIYVHRLNSNQDAEDYCSRLYQSHPDPLGPFLLLLRLYLRPPPPHPIQLPAALTLIATHGTRIDAQAVLDLLPPLVGMAEVQSFFVKTLREGSARRNWGRVVGGLAKARGYQVEGRLGGLEGRRVRIGDVRICPQCHKRIGQSVIAVHAPRGEVTHYQCKDAFSTRLKSMQ